MTTKSRCRQEHGYVFETLIIEKYGLLKNKMRSEYDATYVQGDENIPVQIKCIKYRSSIDCADFYRNQNKSQDFIFVVGFWSELKNKKDTEGVIVFDNTKYIQELHILYIEHVKWNSLFVFKESSEMKAELSLITNLVEDDVKWKNFIKKYKKLWKSGDVKRNVEIRFKRDHKTQKRIQCAINNSVFKKYFLEEFSVFEFEN